MKRLMSLSILIFLSVFACNLHIGLAAKSSNDIAGHWAEGTIQEMINSGIVSGYPDGTFRPDANISRAEYTALIVKAFEIHVVEGNAFNDTATHWARNVITAANQQGIVSGYSETVFAPDDALTREQAAVIIVNAAKIQTAVNTFNFSDKDAISTWAKPQVLQAVGAGIINGYPDNTIRPRQKITRAEAITLLSKIINMQKNKEKPKKQKPAEQENSTEVNQLPSDSSGGSGNNSDEDPVVSDIPANDPTIPTTIIDSTDFIYTGPNPAQTGIDPDIIEEKRVAVLRGRVLKASNEPLAGVSIKIAENPEYGKTLSDKDGYWNMVVNGGGILTVNYEKTGYLPVQRQENVPWQDYVLMPDVVMLEYDTWGGHVSLGEISTQQIAQGKPVTDEDGTRQSTLIFPAGTTAEMVLPGGQASALNEMTVRSTEYTVGSNGPLAMPGQLPANVGYTYCLELSADEAVTAGADEIRFNQMLSHYVDNFLGFPVGSPVPVAYYDRQKQAWLPQKNGRVIQLLSIDDGKAVVDVEGNGVNATPDQLKELGFNDSELQRLAELYQPGQSLWRISIDHFTPFDYNWPLRTPPGAKRPDKKPDPKSKKADKPCKGKGSILEFQNQVLGESLALSGTPFKLNYWTENVPGYKPGIEIPLTGEQVHPDLKEVRLLVTVAGKSFTESFSNQPNQNYTFHWDGKDAYGRTVYGDQKATITVTNVYPQYYVSPQLGTISSFAEYAVSASTLVIPARTDVMMSQRWSIDVSPPVYSTVVNTNAIGNWNLDVCHVYSKESNTLYMGDGTVIKDSYTMKPDITIIAGTRKMWTSKEGNPDPNTDLAGPTFTALGTDGTLYFADTLSNRIRKIAPDGNIYTIAGTGEAGFSGDGGDAVSAMLQCPTGIALDHKGNLYFSDTLNNRIRQVSPDGIITSVAGSGLAIPSELLESSGFNMGILLELPLLLASIGDIKDLNMENMLNDAAEKLTEKLIKQLCSIDNMQKLEETIQQLEQGINDLDKAILKYPEYRDLLVIGNDALKDCMKLLEGVKNIEEIDNLEEPLRAIIKDGFEKIKRLLANRLGEEQPASSSWLLFPIGLDIAPDGTVYFAEGLGCRLRKITPAGMINTVAGYRLGKQGIELALDTQLQLPFQVSIGPNSNIYVQDLGFIMDKLISKNKEKLGDKEFSFKSILTTEKQNIENGDRLEKSNTNETFKTIAGYILGKPEKVAPLDNQPGVSSPVSAGSNLQEVQNPDFVKDELNTKPDNGGKNETNIDKSISASGNLSQKQIGIDGVISNIQHPLTVESLNYYNIKDLVPYYKGILTPAPTGEFYVASPMENVIYRVGRYPNWIQYGECYIPSPESNEIFIFDENGRHLRTVNIINGKLIYKFEYDRQGRLQSIEDADGNITMIQRDETQKNISILAAGGQKTELSINADGNLQSITDPGGNAIKLGYLAGSLLNSFTDKNNNVSHFTYDESGFLVKDENPVGGYTELSSSDQDNGWMVTASNTMNHVRSFAIEELPDGSRQYTKTTENGGIKTAIEKTDGSLQQIYPDGTEVITREGPDPRWGMQAPLTEYNSVTMPSGLCQETQYTRTVELSDPSDLMSVMTITDTATVNGNTLSSIYDAASNTLTDISPEGRQKLTTLDEKGRISSVQLEGMEPLYYQYNSQGYVSEVRQGSLFKTYTYDDRGRVTTVTDSATNQIGYGYDQNDRIISMSLPGGEDYQFQYDANGNRTAVTMPNGVEHRMDYSAVNQQSAYAPPDIGAYSYNYNLDGTIADLTLPGGRKIINSYDEAGRLILKSYEEASIVLDYKENTNNVNTIIRNPHNGSPQQSLSYEYDGSLVTRVAINGAVASQYEYVYDNNFNLTEILANGKDPVSLAYDADGLLTTYGPFHFTRGGPAGETSGISDGTTTTSLEYDPMGRILSRTQTVQGKQIYKMQLNYDSLGHITRKIETSGTNTNDYQYSYDSNDQLIQVNLNGTLYESYSYDQNGNRISKQVAEINETAQYDQQDRLIQQGSLTYQFDQDGLLQNRGEDSFQYSSTGELLKVTSDGQETSYTIDPLGRRAAKTNENGSYQYFYGNPGNLFQITESNSPDGQASSYYYDPAGHLIALERDGSRYYVSTDQLGTPKVVTDSNGEIIKMLQYDSYGNIVNDSTPDFYLPIGFAGGLADDSTGLVRFGFRDYDPISGRWTAKDPILFQSGQGNLYIYNDNNPVEFKDPSGLKTAPCQDDSMRKPTNWQLLWKGMSQCPGAVWHGLAELPGDIFNKDVGKAALQTGGTVTVVCAIPVSMAATASGVTAAGIGTALTKIEIQTATNVARYGAQATSIYNAVRDSLNSPAGYEGYPDGIIGLIISVNEVLWGN